MELRLDPASAVPVYAQVVEQIKALVASRALRVGDLMPSVRDLAARVRINRNTVAKAYQTLEAEGVLETRTGHGTFVADGGSRWSREERLRRLSGFVERAFVEAYHLQLPVEDVREAFERELREFARKATGGARRQGKGE